MSRSIENLDKQILMTDPLVAIGDAVKKYPYHKLVDYAVEVSTKLEQYPCKMLQYSPQRIFEAMMKSNTVVVTRGGRLQAFGQIWEYGEDKEGRKIREFGSLLAEPGFGKYAVMGGIRLHTIKHPDDQLIAVVEENNIPAQKIMSKFGGMEIEGKFSPVLRTVEGEPAWMKRFDMTQGRFFDPTVPVVIKLGGSTVAEREKAVRNIAFLKRAGIAPILVHGGGLEIDAALQEQGIIPEKVNGKRVTDEKTLAVVREVLDKVNISLVSQLNDRGVAAKGYPSDSGLLRGLPEKAGLGFVGSVKGINTSVIRLAIEKGLVPVITPIAKSLDAGYLNVNADTVAGRIADLLGANLLLVTDVPGVAGHDGNLLTNLTDSEYAALQRLGIVKGGMMPKLDAAFMAAGIRRDVLIGDNTQLISAFFGNARGTWIGRGGEVNE